MSIESTRSVGTVHIEPTTPRQTDPSNETRFRQVLQQGASTVLGGVEAAAAFVPGGSVVSAAIQAAASTALTAGGTAGGGVAGAGTPGSGMGDALQQSADQNMQFLQLQQQMQQENQKFTTLSNVLKARHETAKNAIGNIR